MPAFFMQYIELNIENLRVEQKDILVAILPEYGFHSMEELETSIKAYAENNGTNRLVELIPVLDQMGMNCHQRLIAETNWNAAWESNFSPVELPGKIYVRANFHPPKEGFEKEILITPKMSFGTGHHATTKMMMEAIWETDFVGKRVLDFGTGTGILAILAEMRGAAEVLAIDNDPWSVENAEENIKVNTMNKIAIKQGDHVSGNGVFDILLANINKNILTEHVADLKRSLIQNGIIIISGLLSSDYEDICSIYEPYFGAVVKRFDEAGWLALKFNNMSN